MAQEVSTFGRNQFGIVYKQCCASCALKKYTYTGKRFCSLSGEKVDAQDVCEHWQMGLGVKNAGRKSGVVRDIETKEVVIH